MSSHVIDSRSLLNLAWSVEELKQLRELGYCTIHSTHSNRYYRWAPEGAVIQAFNDTGAYQEDLTLDATILWQTQTTGLLSAILLKTREDFFLSLADRCTANDVRITPARLNGRSLLRMLRDSNW
jgi:hypothetical protein